VHFILIITIRSTPGFGRVDGSKLTWRRKGRVIPEGRREAPPASEVAEAIGREDRNLTA